MVFLGFTVLSRKVTTDEIFFVTMPSSLPHFIFNP